LACRRPRSETHPGDWDLDGSAKSKTLLIPVEQRIFLIRGQKVMLDADLALLYGVEARSLNQAVSRNRQRFPADFMFQLSDAEYESLLSQTVIPTRGKPLISVFSNSLNQSLTR
jgi:ORF6N domain